MGIFSLNFSQFYIANTYFSHQSELNIFVLISSLLATSSLEQFIHQVALEQAKLSEVLRDVLFHDGFHQVRHVLILYFGKNLVIIDKLLKFGIQVELL